VKTDVSRPTTSCFQQRYEFSAPALPLPPSLPPCQSNLTAEPRSRLYNTPVSCTVVVITQVTAGVSYDVTSVKVTQGQTGNCRSNTWSTSTAAVVSYATLLVSGDVNCDVMATRQAHSNYKSPWYNEPVYVWSGYEWKYRIWADFNF